jgi:hypothetical protein
MKQRGLAKRANSAEPLFREARFLQANKKVLHVFCAF